MRRIAIAERPDWRERAAELGFSFHSPNGEPYWDERAYYAFSLQEIERDIEAPSQELDEMCRMLVDRVVRSEALLTRLRIPETAWDAVRTSWHRNAPSLYGRFDFSYTGEGPAKLLEYNADTPTSLYEAAAFQWFWLEDQVAAGRLPEGADQYNSIHEKLVARFRELSGQGVLHLACVDQSIEDRGTIAYIEECARQGGFETKFIAMSDIGLGGDGQFYDLEMRPIHRLFKLYPWEWMFGEPFAEALLRSHTGMLEPPWKAVLSNKGILPLLWEMAPGHPNLLEAYFDDDPKAEALRGAYARKPLYSREGANVELVRDGQLLDGDGGPYGGEGHIIQALAPLPEFDGNHAVVGSWIIAGKAAGLGMREDRSAITKNTSRFVPHAIVG
jgi:glutathionylspermidine synthase